MGSFGFNFYTVFIQIFGFLIFGGVTTVFVFVFINIIKNAKKNSEVTNSINENINDTLKDLNDNVKEEKEEKLIKCEYCDSMISEKSSFCPNCGAKVSHK